MVENIITLPYPKGSGAFNVSNIVQLVEGGCPRNTVTIPLGRRALNVSPIVQGSRNLVCERNHRLLYLR